MLKCQKSKTKAFKHEEKKGFNFNREEAHSRDGKWEKVANKMRETMSK
jgi:hypothetical protein